MFTTIEPRLIALLNKDESPEPFTTSSSRDLPPLQNLDLVIIKPPRPLLLEPDASKRNASADSQLAPKPSGLLSSVSSDSSSHKRSGLRHKSDHASKDRALGNSSPQSLRKILDDDTDNSTAISSKKRNIAEQNKEDFITLPQPPKKLKAAKQVVPPIISGLFQPPPQAALFPPIASSSFHDSHGRNSLNTTTPKVGGLGSGLLPATSERPQQQGTTTKGNEWKQDVRPRKKWTEEETTNLLLGVTKHGVGNWTDIVEDPSFTFNGRNGTDLKDRWRTCCPAELLGSSSKPINSRTGKDGRPQTKSTSSLMSENILIEEEGAVTTSRGGGDPTMVRKSRAHRKRIEDLIELGIQGPLRRSLRRERRSFAEEEDLAILEGYELYGPAWTRIQRDPRFNLLSRQPTDLRDRFRNKYPDKLRVASKFDMDTLLISTAQQPSVSQGSESRFKDNLFGSFPQSLSDILSAPFETDNREQGPKEKPGTTGSAYQSLSNREGLRIQEIISPGEEDAKAIPQAQNSAFTFRDNFVTFPEQPPLDTSDGLPFTQPFDWNQGISAPFSNGIGEMDISRLLLCETWSDLPNPGAKEKPSFTDINSIITSSAEPLHNLPSFLTMLNEVDQIDEMNETSFE